MGTKKMNKKEIFILLVQTYVLSAGTRKSINPLNAATFAVSTVAEATEVAAENLPNMASKLADYAKNFCEWKDGKPGVTKPFWLP
jgi:hypothetical protein